MKRNYLDCVAVFDLDNTLIDSKEKLTADVVQTFARLGKTITPEEVSGDWYALAKTYGIDREIFDREFGNRKTWQQSLEDREVPIFPETREVLESLKQREVRLALLSKSIPEYTEVKLDYFDLRKYFEQVATVHPKVPDKNQAAVDLVSRLNPGTIDRAYFIGDKEEDVVAADVVGDKYELNSSGIYVNRKGEQLQKYRSVKSLDEIPEIIFDRS